MKISVVSGGFDPIHSGHISYLKEASEISNKLVVCLNSDVWLAKKKGKPFLPFAERKCILESIKYVDEVISFKDDELGSCINGIEKVSKKYPKDEIIFCNGGDRTKKNIPEMVVKDIEFMFGVGGADKQNSSSWLLKNWKYDSENRVWGSFYNFYDSQEVKVKELVVNPKKGMSFQRHNHRNEIWLVIEGSCEVNYADNNPELKETIVLNKFDKFVVKKGQWHQITNPFEKDCHLIELQYGNSVVEEDIERLSLYNEKNI